MMRIAMMTNNYKPFIGGVPISIERLSEGLRAIGHEVVVFAPDYKGQEADENIVRYHSFIKGIVNGVSVPNSLDSKIEKEFREGNFDLIHVHHPMLIGRTALYLSRKYNVPLCFTYHTKYEQYLHYIKAPFLADLVPYYVNDYISQCDMVFAPTPSMRDYLSEIGSGTSLAVLPTGIGSESFEADGAEVESLRNELLGGKKYLFCTVARLAKEKNIDFLFRALAMRKNRQMDKSADMSDGSQDSDFRLAIVGEGPYRKELEKLAQKLNIREEIVFVGKVSNAQVKNYCKAADLFLFASRSETQGIVLLEAMAAATPVLAVNATGVRDVVINGRNGYMTYMSEEEYNSRLDSLLEQDMRYLKQGALETAGKYEMQEIAKSAAVYYNTAIQNHRQNPEKVRGIRRIIALADFGRLH
ncbi:MAG: glycosyltransferase family 4 protein [Lachnospiraceae bacterium]|nr:glycosyltransferase family 4 protein [Lachnospiraceae bacterium]